MWRRHNFSGGIRRGLPPELIPANTMAGCCDMLVTDNGELQAARAETLLRHMGDYIAGTRAWLWKPSRVPAGSNGSPVVIYTKLNKLWYAYAGADTVHAAEIAAIASFTTVSVSMDGNQFVFVDGMSGTPARRLVISSSGAIECITMGSPQPTWAPEVTRITVEENRDEEYTGMPAGSILLYSYTVMNHFGEISNPSPVSVVDGAQWQVKGNYDSGSYEYDEHNRGSIKNVTLMCRVPDRARAKTLFLYRTSAEYTESNVPVPPAQLVGVYPLGGLTEDQVTVSDVSFPAPQIPDYENDPAPAADHVAVIGDKVFLGNTGNESVFAFPATSALRVVLTNPNQTDYLNQWFQVCLYDDTHPASLRNYPGTFDLRNSMRWIDSDRITPLLASHTNNQGYQHPGTAESVTTGNMFFIQIPVVPAKSQKTIYLVKFSVPVEEYGKPIMSKSFNTLLTEGKISLTRVRSERQVICYDDLDPSISVVGMNANRTRNKANARDAAAIIRDTPEQQLLSPQGLVNRDWYGIGVGVSPIAQAPYYSINEHSAAALLAAVDVTKTELYLTVRISGASVFSNSWVLLAGTPLYRLWVRRRVQDERQWISFFYLRPAEDNPGNFQGQIEMEITEHSTLYAKICIIATYELDQGHAKVGFACEYMWQGDPSSDPLKYMSSTMPTVYAVNLAAHARIYLLPRWLSGHNIVAGQMQFYVGQSGSNRLNILQRFAGLPTFDNEAMGALNVTDVESTKYLTNINVGIETMTELNTLRPGKLRWSRGGSLPETNERMINEGIAAIFPMRSLAPTEERNTVLIWTTNGDMMRLAFHGDKTEIVTDAYGVGFPTMDGVVGVGEGVAFITADTRRTYLYSANGLREISSRELGSTPNRLFYLAGANSLLMRHGTEYLYYNLLTGSWSPISTLSNILRAQSVGGTDYMVGVLSGSTSEISLFTMNGARKPFSITTRRYPISGINRINIIGTAQPDDRVVVRALLHGSKFTGGMAESQYTPEIEINKPFSIPGIRGAKGIQLVITGAIDKLSYIEIDQEGAEPEEQ